MHFGKKLGEQVKGRSPKKLKLLIDVPNAVHVKVHVLSFNMILISSPQRVSELSISEKIWAIRECSFSEKAKNFNRGSLSMSSESTCF